MALRDTLIDQTRLKADSVAYVSRTMVNLGAMKAVIEQRESDNVAPHVAPFSTLVACMGAHWEPGCFEAVYKMCEHASDEGALVKLYEQPDLCYQPFDAIGTMRNEAYMKALAGGFEFLLYLDNDVLPESDTLSKLLRRYLPIVLPIPEYTKRLEGGSCDHADCCVACLERTEHGHWCQVCYNLAVPRMVHNQGIRTVRSSVISCVLFKTAVFLPWATVPFWENALGAAEEYHFDRLFLAGHQPWVDTDVVVKILKAPHFPLDHKAGDKPLSKRKEKIWTP